MKRFIYFLSIFMIYLFSTNINAQEEYISSYTGEQIDQAIANALNGNFPAGSISFTELQKIEEGTLLGKYTTIDGLGEVSSLTSLQVKALLDLSNVENIKLSTWTGSSNIVTLGTVTSGTWAAGIIDVTRGGTGANNAPSARANLGLSIGTNVQAYHNNLDNLSFSMHGTVLNFLSSNSYPEMLGYLLPESTDGGSVFMLDEFFQPTWSYDIDSLKMNKLVFDTEGSISLSHFTDAPAEITYIGSVGGEGGIRVKETVQISGDTPTFGIHKDGNISDLHPPTPMTSSHDWHFQDRSGTIALLDDISQQDIFYYGLTESLTPKDIILLRTPYDIQIDSLAAVVVGDNIDFNISFGDSIAGDLDIFAADETLTETGTGTIYTSFANDVIVKARWIIIKITLAEGASTHFSVTIYYTKI